MSDLFKILESINVTKTNMITTAEEEKSYPAFMVNRGLSYHMDTIFLAQEMNRNHHLDNKLQYDFLMSSIRKKKRFSKWFKPQADIDLQAVQEYFGYNTQRAREALNILSKEDIEDIKQKLFKGGKA